MFGVWCGWPVCEVICLCSRGGSEGGRVATPTSFSIFDSYDMKTLRFRLGHENFTCFQLFYEMKLKTSKLKSWHF